MLKRVKELFLVFVLTALTVCLFPVTVNAASSGSCGDNVTWKLSDDGTLTISGQGDIADCTKESQPWSSVKDQIKKVVIEDGVGKIGKYAFYGCKTLEELVNNGGTVGAEAFELCTNLKKITIGENCKILAVGSFMNCAKLESVTLPEKMNNIAGKVFENCTSLKELQFPEGLHKIYHDTIGGCTNLTTIWLPSTLEEVWSEAFSTVKNLKTVYYNGTKEDWDKISIAENNDPLLNADIIYKKDAAPTPTPTPKPTPTPTPKPTPTPTAEPASDVIVMHRLYNKNSGEHFYTANEKEKDALVTYGWDYEGIGWYAPASSKTPVYRLYNSRSGDHHYTMKEKERDALVSFGWTYEKVGWYSDDAESVPLYREYNPNMEKCNHNYTTNKKEHDALTTLLGWRDEGIGWYGVNN